MVTQKNIENYTRQILTTSNREYLRRISQGNDKEAVLNEITEYSLRQLHLQMQ